MTKPQKYLWVGFGALELLVLLAVFTRPAYGYVDPGSGLLAIQVGGSMLAGAFFMLRSKIRRLFRLSPVKDASQETQPAEPGK